MAVLDRLLPGVTEWAENAALYALIVLFWAFILYFALQSL
jgi:hypothetical protein